MHISSLLTVALVAASGALAANSTNTVLENVKSLVNKTSKAYQLSSAYTLASSLGDVVNALGNTKNQTLFAPTDAAFAAFTAQFPTAFGALSANSTLLSDALLYHVVPNVTFVPSGAKMSFVPTANPNNWIQVTVAAGNAVTLAFDNGTAKVIDSIPSSNGIIHVIDTVLVAPRDAPAVLTQNGLDTLVQSVEAANLTSAVSNLNNATLFAPTDAAFKTVLSFASTNGLNISENMLAAILKFHVVPGTYFSTDIIAAKSVELATLLSGQNINATYDGSKVTLSGDGNTALKFAPATVTKANVLVNGGVAHIIDAVILPNITVANATGAGDNNGTDSTGAGSAKNAASSVAASVPVLAAVAALMALVM
ncbi:hypothetical protein HKX48_007947 [Thoreauomyces humboldtii]|nr:hypothetical protein HKX48_007947 [Thoreauomyces humboldtii]